MNRIATERPPMAVRALVGVLRQLDDLLVSLTDEQYTRPPVGVTASAIGGHVRHNLDHVRTLLAGLRTGWIDYDQRDRTSNVATNRIAARAALAGLTAGLLEFPWHTAPAALALTALIAPDLPPLETQSTPERELVFVLSHTIHHNALIAVIVVLVGATPPAEFGHAPSTIAYQRSQPCVR